MPLTTKIQTKIINIAEKGVGNFLELLERVVQEDDKDKIAPVEKHFHSSDDDETHEYKEHAIQGDREEEQDASATFYGYDIPEEKREQFFVEYFQNLHNAFKNHPSGSTATIPYISKKGVDVRSVGDSEAYLQIQYEDGEVQTVLLTRNHDAKHTKTIEELPDGVGVVVDLKDEDTHDRIFDFQDTGKVGEGSYMRCSLVDKIEKDKEYARDDNGELITNEQGKFYCKDSNGRHYVKNKEGTYTIAGSRGWLNVLNTIGDKGITKTWIDTTSLTFEEIAIKIFGKDVDLTKCRFGVISCCDGVTEGATGYCCDYRVSEDRQIIKIPEEEKDLKRNISNLKKVFDGNPELKEHFGSFAKYLVMSAFCGSDLNDSISKDGEIEFEITDSPEDNEKALCYGGIIIGYISYNPITKELGNEVYDDGDEDNKKLLFTIGNIKEVEQDYHGKKSGDNIMALYCEFTLETLTRPIILASYDGHGKKKQGVEGGEVVSEAAAKYLQARVELHYGKLPRIWNYKGYSEESFEPSIAKTMVSHLNILLLYGSDKEKMYAAKILVHKSIIADGESRIIAIHHLIEKEQISLEELVSLMDKVSIPELDKNNTKEVKEKCDYKCNLARILLTQPQQESTGGEADNNHHIQALCTLAKYSDGTEKIDSAYKLQELILSQLNIGENNEDWVSAAVETSNDAQKESLIISSVAIIKHEIEVDEKTGASSFLLRLIKNIKNPEHYSKEKILALRTLIKHDDDQAVKVDSAKELLKYEPENILALGTLIHYDEDQVVKADAAKRILELEHSDQEYRDLAIKTLIENGVFLPLCKLTDSEDWEFIRQNMDAVLLNEITTMTNDPTTPFKEHKEFFFGVASLLKKLATQSELETSEEPGVKKFISKFNAESYLPLSDKISEKLRDPKYEERRRGKIENKVPKIWLSIMQKQSSKITRRQPKSKINPSSVEKTHRVSMSSML